MNPLRLIRNNLAYYWKKNLWLALGIAVSGAVITGALMVGDSVRHSLDMITGRRLGRVTHVLKAGDRYFTGALASRVGERTGIPDCPLLMQDGSAVAGGGQVRVNRVRVIGAGPGFDAMAGTGHYYSMLSGDSIIISSNLATRLNVSAGEEILLRIDKASLIPLNAPFVSGAEQTVTIRATIRDVAGSDSLGGFNLKVSQTAPFNVFISLSRLQELMDLGERVNTVLFDASSGKEPEIMDAVREDFSAEDAGLELTWDPGTAKAEVTSRRVFIDGVLSDILRGLEPPGEGILTYFVNALYTRTDTTPYSFVSTLPDSWLRRDEIILNSWLASDLDAGAGDTVAMDYFVVGPLRELEEASARFRVKAVVPMEGRFGDPGLVPDLPGLSDVGNCRDWETGVPIDLDRIRDRDEDYWDAYGGTPKAFISVSRGIELWQNRFGSYTAFRFDTIGLQSLEAGIVKDLDPASIGFALEPARLKGDKAAAGGVDFSQLFGGLSFFLLLAGILLTVLLFLLNLESREEQLGTLVVMGIPARVIRRVMAAEAVLVSVSGALLGLVLAVVYSRLVFLALNGVWRDVVHTEMMQLQVVPSTLATGWTVTLVISLLALWFPLNRKLRERVFIHKKKESGAAKGWKIIPGRPAGTARRIITGGPAGAARRIPAGGLAVWIAGACGAASMVLIATQLAGGEIVNATIFFSAGGLLLAALVLFFLWYLGKVQESSGKPFSMAAFSWKNASRNRTRSMSIVILFAIGAFLVISTGSNRKDLFAGASEPGSGTGGFLYYAESTVPVLRRLDDPAVRNDLGLGGDYSLVQFRRAEGDDASCLNLNKIVTPQVLGADPARLEGRFSFVTRTGLLDEEHPWQSLDRELPGGLIPAVADETVIKWGLGLEVGDTLHHTNAGGGTMDLLLVGGLAPSIFQGNVIISNQNFLGQFPGSSGTNVFLVEGAEADTAVIRAELDRGMRDLGWDMQLCSARLAEFNSVTNAYLSIFMVMGALGLLLGTFGLVAVLSRSILERRREIALLHAVGYGRRKIRKLITREYLVLLAAGIAGGFGTAVIATLPSLVSPNTGTSFTTILVWLGILAVNGWFWIQVVTRTALAKIQIQKGLSDE